MADDTQSRLLEAITDCDRIAAVSLVEDWIREHGYPSAVSDVIEPVLFEIGTMYEEGKSVSLAFGYVAAKVLEDVFQGDLMAAQKTGLVEDKGTVVLGNIEDDCHALGRKMVGSFLHIAGWTVIDLGNDVPAARFVDAAEENGARIIGVSAMMHTTALKIVRVREELERRNLSGKIQLAVGGAIFVMRPELVDSVGGDGTARSAFQATALFEDLLARAKKNAP